MAKFDPKEHLMTVKGGAQYLEVKWRLVWFREEFPNGTMVTEPIEITPQLAIFKATVTAVDNDGKVRGSATGYKTCTPQQFKFGYVEKAETGALGRALACLGFGTQFEPEFDEGDQIVDSPVERPQTARNAPKPRNPNVDPSTFSDRELDTMARDQGPQHPPAEKKAWEAKSRYLHGIADHDFLHAVAEVWKFKSWADVPLNKLVELDSYLNGKADPAVQPAFNSFRKNWEEQNKKSAMKRQAELLPGTDVVPNPRTADDFTR